MVVEMDVRINGLSGLYNRFGFQPVDALRFENGEEIFRHSIVVTVSPS